MSASAVFSRACNLRRLYQGPLTGFIDRYADRLLDEGHCQQSAWRSLKVVGDFSRWLERRRLGLQSVNECTIEQYLKFRYRYRRLFVSDRPALVRLLSILRECSAVTPAPAVIASPHDQIIDRFCQYLRQERGLVEVSIVRHVPTVRRLLAELAPAGIADVASLTQEDLLTFIERHIHDHSVRSAQIMGWTLRVFTRYLHGAGDVRADLSVGIPSIRNWKLAHLPAHLSFEQVKRVLDAFDRRSAIGRRDYAIVLMLLRIGLRANEVATLRLEDIDWRSGQLTVHGKGRKEALMPLPQDVGRAVVAYIRNGRPVSRSRRLFLRHLAPHIGFASSANVSFIAKAALDRADIDGLAHRGAHVFRHTLATELLRSGASLPQIGQVLRHQDPDTTRIYAKVDIRALQSIGLPWPGGAQ